ncbi:MAG TPA: DALR anticodon-binding domain-containing protein, partial [Anaerolineae bacterium]|nr:DALR anticodon-binding domain-containing protein [Anaerolineae bacterium]
ADAQVRADALDYIVQRLRGALLDEGLRYDVVDAVLVERGYDPYWAAQTARALNEWVARPDWQDLLNAYARCVRIVRDQETRYEVDPERFVESASKVLYKAVQDARASIPEEDPPIDDVLEAILGIVPEINVFFDEVLVMDPDPEVRQNRLGLVQSVSALIDGAADLSKLEGF